jgi:subtilisin-like proprotein convertase family protein
LGAFAEKRAGALALAAVVALACFCCLTSSASAEVLETPEGGPITIPTSGNATPYPYTIATETGDGNITDVDVRVRLTHAIPDEVDIVLVSPDGDSAVLMSDVCGSPDLNDVTFTFDSDAAFGLADSGPCGTSTVQPSNAEPGTDNWLSPGPGAVTASSLDAFDGEDPNGQWRLFAADDTGGDGGTIHGWSLRITTGTAEIVIPGTGTAGKASKYPATKTATAPSGEVIQEAKVSWPDFNHTHPDDVDALLEGPNGANVMLMSDACGSADIHDFSWTFADTAPAQMTDSDLSGCNPFSIKPTDFGTPENLPAPAPQRPYGTNLEAFKGLDGGQWRLWIQDDAGGDTGFITNWEMQLTTRAAADAAYLDASAAGIEGDSVDLAVRRTGPAALGPATIDVSLVPGSADATDYTAPPAKLTFARGESLKTISVPIKSDGSAEPLESFKVRLSNPQDDARLTSVKDAEIQIAASSGSPGSGGPGGGSGDPSNEFSFGKAEKQKNGSAILPVIVPGPGELAAADKAIKPATAQATEAGTVDLLLKPAKKAKKKLKKGKKVKAGVEVTFTPSGGDAAVQDANVTLKKKPKKK